jgi:hypothetical protein
VEIAEIARNDASGRSYFAKEDYNPLLWEKELPEKSPFKQVMLDFLGDQLLFVQHPVY